MTICTLRTIAPYPLAGLLALLILWTATAAGSSLRDIRIGEYDGFTRIVFELDTPVTSQTINPQDAGQLLVTLGNTTPRLVRKIPVERSAHVRDIQFWQRRGNLTPDFKWTTRISGSSIFRSPILPDWRWMFIHWRRSLTYLVLWRHGRMSRKS
jgi:hypothetical protein